jgi:putative hydrolase of the HAD superfamily
MIKYIFFDVAGTILSKPSLFEKLNNILLRNGYDITIEEIKFKHKLLSEVIFFPDNTNKDFYKLFNSELLRLFGIIPDEKILLEIFNECTYLPWQKFEDTVILDQIDIPIGIISNFNKSLNQILEKSFKTRFSDILISEELGVAKPSLDFYKRAIEKIEFNPGEILYIGDSMKLDIEPATKLGIKCLLIDRDRFYKISKYKITNLAEILNHI